MFYVLLTLLIMKMQKYVGGNRYICNGIKLKLKIKHQAFYFLIFWKNFSKFYLFAATAQARGDISFFLSFFFHSSTLTSPCDDAADSSHGYNADISHNVSKRLAMAPIGLGCNLWERRAPKKTPAGLPAAPSIAAPAVWIRAQLKKTSARPGARSGRWEDQRPDGVADGKTCDQLPTVIKAAGTN